MTITVAIVEDLDEVREGLVKFINNDPDFKVLDAFSNAEEALISLPHLQPDIVIMDINLPGMNGIDLVALIHLQYPGLPCLMLSGNNEAE